MSRVIGTETYLDFPFEGFHLVKDKEYLDEVAKQMREFRDRVHLDGPFRPDQKIIIDSFPQMDTNKRTIGIDRKHMFPIVRHNLRAINLMRSGSDKNEFDPYRTYCFPIIFHNHRVPYNALSMEYRTKLGYL